MTWQPPYRLYVVEFCNGVIKAGITAQPGTNRFRTFGKHGPIRRHFITPQEVGGFSIEYDLCKRLARIGTVIRGREWFTGIRFPQAVQLAKQVARSRVGADPRSLSGAVSHAEQSAFYLPGGGTQPGSKTMERVVDPSAQRCCL